MEVFVAIKDISGSQLTSQNALCEFPVYIIDQKLMFIIFFCCLVLYVYFQSYEANNIVCDV